MVDGKRIQVSVLESDLIQQLNAPLGDTEFHQGWSFAIQAADHPFIEDAACRQLGRPTANCDPKVYILDVLHKKANPLRPSLLQLVGNLLAGHHEGLKVRAVEILGRQRNYSLEQAVAAGFGEAQGRHTYFALTRAASAMFDSSVNVVAQGIAVSADLNDFAVGHTQGIYRDALLLLYDQVIQRGRSGHFGDRHRDIGSQALAAALRVGKTALKDNAPNATLFANCILCSADMQHPVREQALTGLDELCPFAELPGALKAPEDND